MKSPPAENLEEAIQQAGEGWLIDLFGPPHDAVSYLREKIAQVNVLAQQRFGANAPDLSENALLAAYNQQPLKVKGFFQILGSSRTPDMLLMAWRILQGMEIKDVEISYRRQDHFRVRVILESPYGDEEELYESNSIKYFTLFRHIGIMEISGKPVFDGFYALKLT